MKTLPENTLRRIFWVFVILHTLIWTITPVLIRGALSDDFIEAFIWGQHLAFGYDKNPWLPGWLAHLGILTGGQSGLGIYLIQSLFIATGFYAVWRLMLACSRPAYALIAVMMYEACACYSIDLQVYNDNYILMGLLPLASLLFYQAIHRNRWRDWLGGGFVTGLCLVAKYDAVLFALSMICFLVLHPEKRRRFSSPRPYVAMAVGLLILLPNLYWLYQHDFQTLQYAFEERAGFSRHGWSHPLKANIKFVAESILAFIPALLLGCLAIQSQKKAVLSPSKPKGTHEDVAFLFWAGLGPIMFLLMLGFGLGLVLHREWGNTFMALWGAFLLVKWHPEVSRASLIRFVIAVFGVMLILPAGYIMISLQKDTGNYPGAEIARRATDTWHKHYHTPLRFVAGDRYTAGYVALHSPDQPAVWMEWDNRVSPWIDINEVKCRGAIFIQDSGHTRQHFYKGKAFPKAVRKTFPRLILEKPIQIPWTRNRLQQSSLTVYIGRLPPDPRVCKKFHIEKNL